MIPYVTVRVLYVNGIAISLFGVLLVTAVLAGFTLAVRQGRRHGIGREQIAAVAVWLVAGGFVGSRLFKMVYYPDFLVAAFSAPELWLRSYGLSSFGGLFGGCLALGLYFWRRKPDRRVRLAILDCLGFAMPFAWTIGRMGCALAHDHPGRPSASALAVAFPGGSRYDLGVLEVFFHLLLAACFLYLCRSQRPVGFYFAAFFCAYGPFRLLLDQLHVDPPRYFGLPVDVYASVSALIVGLAAVAVIRPAEATNPQKRGTSCLRAFSIT